MPRWLVEADLANGTLIKITIEDEPRDPYVLPYIAMYPPTDRLDRQAGG